MSWQTVASALGPTPADSREDVAVPRAWRMQRPVAALELAFITFVVSLAVLVICVGLKVDGVFDSSWYIVLLPTWLLQVATLVSIAVACVSGCQLVFVSAGPGSSDSVEGPRLVLGTVLTAWGALVAVGLVVVQEVLIADVADGSRGSTYAALTPFFVLGGLMVCNTCICGTRSAHSLLFSVAIAATTVLVALKVENDINWSWWLVLLPASLSCIALVVMMLTVRIRAHARKPSYRLTDVQERALRYYTGAASLALLAIALFALRQDVYPLRVTFLDPYPYALSVVAVPLALAVLLFCIAAAEVMHSIAEEALREGRLTHKLPGTAHDVDGGEEWWILLGRVELLSQP